jgi:LuxR family transcriptional regulator, activator of tox operons
MFATPIHLQELVEQPPLDSTSAGPASGSPVVTGPALAYFRKVIAGTATMTADRRPPIPSSDWLSDAIAAICEPRFATTMLEVVDRHVMRVNHCAVVRLLRASVAQVFTNATITNDPDHATAAIRYIDGYFRHDPNLRLVRDAAKLQGRVMVRDLKASDIKHRGYRVECYEATGIVHRVSLITGTQSQGLVALNFHRVKASGLYSPDELARIKTVALPLVTIARRHVELLANTSTNADAWRLRLKVIRHDLTTREVEVAARMLAGESLREIADCLGVAHSSAVTYRERAYRRLGVQNLKELRLRASGI